MPPKLFYQIVQVTRAARARGHSPDSAVRGQGTGADGVKCRWRGDAINWITGPARILPREKDVQGTN